MIDPVGAHGQGGITRRGDGRLQVSITMPNGRRVYRMVPAMADKRRQRKRADDLRRDLITAREWDLDPSSQTLADYLRSWLDSMAGAVHVKQRPRTLEFYEMVIERHIIPSLGRIRLDRLSERHIQAWVDGDPGAARSVHHHRAVLRRALNVAMRKRIIGRNPALAIDLPELEDESGDPFTADETRRLLEATHEDRLAALWRLALVTGMRQGELLGLAWQDIDLDGGRVTITGQLQRVKGEWVRATTKATRSLHSIAIDPTTVAVLRVHQRRMAEGRKPDWKFWGLVFTTTKGNPWSRSDILRAFHAACDAAGIKRQRFHDMRHANATLLRDAGVSEEVRQARLGHSTKDMSRHYAKASVTQDREAVELLAKVIGG